MGLYGRGFLLSDPNNNGLYADAPQPISAGPYTREPGTWGYNEVKQIFIIYNVSQHSKYTRFHTDMRKTSCRAWYVDDSGRA